MDLFDKAELQAIGQQLLSRNETVAVAESVTSGMLQFAFSNMADAAKFYQGGLTAYNLGQKYKHLHVEPIHAAAVNCVSGQVAHQMAFNACAAFMSDWGMAITGYATPVPEADNKLFAYYAIVYHKNVFKAGKILGKNVDPPDMQMEYTRSLLSIFLEVLQDDHKK